MGEARRQGPDGVGASMKGFPRRGSDAHVDGPVRASPRASMKGFPRRGSDVVRDRDDGAREVVASMKGFPRRGSDPPMPQPAILAAGARPQ